LAGAFSANRKTATNKEYGVVIRNATAGCGHLPVKIGCILIAETLLFR
jgi:hypothetical protein